MNLQVNIYLCLIVLSNSRKIGKHFSFKTDLKLEDYLELLTAIFDDKTDENKLKESNKKRVQLIFQKLLILSSNWDTKEIEKS